jgi:hypothetical protein
LRQQDSKICAPIADQVSAGRSLNVLKAPNLRPEKILGLQPASFRLVLSEPVAKRLNLNVPSLDNVSNIAIARSGWSALSTWESDYETVIKNVEQVTKGTQRRS